MPSEDRIRVIFKVALLSVCTINIGVNTLFLLQSQLAALIPIGVNALVVYEYTRRPDWGRIATKAFAVLAILGDITTWILLLAGRNADQSVVLLGYRTLLIFIAVFLLRYINVGMPLGKGPPSEEQEHT